MPGNSQELLPPEADPKKALPKEMDVLVVNLDKTLLEGKAKSIILPVPYGNLAVLSGHTPIFTKLVKGIINVNLENGTKQDFEIENGIAKITQYKATILVGF
jgi:F0F1-type ATP synthase epsilon subunit